MDEGCRTNQNSMEEGLVLNGDGLEEAEWVKANESAIAAYNLHVEVQGAFSDGLRAF